MTTTQQQFPARATRRTAFQVVIAAILILGIVLPIAVQIIGEELGDWIPGPVIAWLVAGAAFMAALAAAVARIMAIPQVDAWLKHVGLASAPALTALEEHADTDARVLSEVEHRSLSELRYDFAMLDPADPIATGLAKALRTD